MSGASTKGFLRWLRLAAGLAILAGLIAYMTPNSLIVQWQLLEASWLLAAAAAILVSTVVGSYALFLLIGRDQFLHFGRFLRAYWMSWGVGLVVPGQVGDVAMLTVLMQRRGLHWPTSLGRSLLDKLISLAVLGGFAAWGLRDALPALHLAPVPLVAVIAGAGLVALSAWLAFRLLGRGNPGAMRLSEAARTILSEIALSARQHPGRTAGNVILTVLKFGGIVLAYWCVFRALGQDQLEYFRALPLVAISALVAYIPVSFNGLGTVEFAGIWLFGGAGIAQAAVLSAYLLLRVMVLTIAWVPVSLGMLFARASGQENP